MADERPSAGQAPVPTTARATFQVHDEAAGIRWTFDENFLRSDWTCVWGNGCQGIHDKPTPELAEGCCSLGAELLDSDEAMTISALAACIDETRFERADEAAANGVFATADRKHTRVVDGSCIFFNRPGFSGGAGCALHLEALAHGEQPLDWKPSVCWQLPLKIDRTTGADGVTDAVLRRWRREDWGPGGSTMAWCCTESADAFVGERPVVESLGAEIEALVGPEVAVELRRRLS